jgi:hypothetical protein
MSNLDHSSWQNCANWYNKAKALKRASDKIREDYLVAYRNMNIGKHVSRDANGTIKVDIDMTKLDIEDLDQYSIAMLLMGYTMENIFRGIIVTAMWLEDPKKVNSVTNFADLAVPVKGGTTLPILKHNLRRLLNAIGIIDIDFDESEKTMMDTLDMFIKHGGRYATPKEYDPSDPFGLSRLEPIEYPYQALDSLYQKSMEKLIELCKKQGEKSSQ